MKFNLNAKIIRVPPHRRSTSMSNAFRPLLAELREAVARHVRRAARAKHLPRPVRVERPVPLPPVAPLPCWKCDKERECDYQPCPHCGADALPF
jgi:hypothetical protein